MRFDPTNATRIALVGALTAGLGLAGCSRETAPDPKTQIGARPDLPALQQYLMPPMHVASVVGWKQGGVPSISVSTCKGCSRHVPHGQRPRWSVRCLRQSD
ncbi:hypothetical protein ACVWW1_004261 [Bradyrhizobium sp. JR3.5]